jgi:hypothetical protein
MTTEQLLSKIAEAIGRTNNLIGQLIKTTDRLAQDSAPLSPNYRRKLSEFPTFDWASIDARVVAVDTKGFAADVEWRGHRFDRSSGSKFDGDFIIFSRPSPEWSQQNKVYYTLIKFADYNKFQPVAAQAEQSPARDNVLPLPQAAPVGAAASRPVQQAASQTNDNGLQIAQPVQNARLEFYKIGGEAMSSQAITIDKFNALVAKAGRSGFEAALTELQAVVGGAV